MAERLPPLAPVPPAGLRLSIAPQEWQACLAAWLTLADLHLRLPTKSFASLAGNDAQLGPFLTSFFRELNTSRSGDQSFTTPEATRLKKSAFLLTNRCIDDTLANQSWLQDLESLSHFCATYTRSSRALEHSVKRLWERRKQDLETAVQKRKTSLTSTLDSKDPSPALTSLTSLAPVCRASPEISSIFMLGSDFLLALATAYTTSSATEHRKAISIFSYLCLVSLVHDEHLQLSLLSDHLYTLKSDADQHKNQASLLADLATNTPLLAKLRRTVANHPSDRLQTLVGTLETYRMPSIARSRPRPRSTARKDKGKAPAGDGEFHMHRLSLVTQVQDLFPDLGSGFILKLLEEYNEDVEQVTAHLLDETLPAHLSGLDRTEEAPIPSEQTYPEHLAPRSTPPRLQNEPFIPDRHNKFDNDSDLSTLQLGTSRLHIGKKDTTTSTTSTNPSKAAILSALAAFDSDDDERDDTYDMEDVGGTVDTTLSSDETPIDEIALFKAYKSSPGIFGRTFDVRKSQARGALKQETGMTDEAIEGWAIMLQRDPGRLRKLEGMVAVGGFDGRQDGVGSTAWRGGTDTEDSDTAGRGGFRGRGRGRGRGGRGGRGGGDVAGSSSDPNTANAQRRKEASKGSRANHNRRDQRAKKMARGGFAG